MLILTARIGSPFGFTYNHQQMVNCCFKSKICFEFWCSQSENLWVWLKRTLLGEMKSILHPVSIRHSCAQLSKWVTAILSLAFRLPNVCTLNKMMYDMSHWGGLEAIDFFSGNIIIITLIIICCWSKSWPIYFMMLFSSVLSGSTRTKQIKTKIKTQDTHMSQRLK